MAFFDKILKMQDSIRPICTVVVPAAGTSRRMGGANKLFMELDGVPDQEALTTINALPGVHGSTFLARRSDI